ncbi:hypothetical protein [Streptomyces sp. SA15]|uniref:hypothetical protein n=1 Tax=Streptomyces sp. SA15 TaxID=934019 RepID=UPI0015C9DD6D|nr:hypothetical protein [Streptomyces sp. SA15]
MRQRPGAENWISPTEPGGTAAPAAGSTARSLPNPGTGHPSIWVGGGRWPRRRTDLRV